MERILWPQENFADLFDEFVVRDCRVRFLGGWIDVQALSEGAEPAAVLDDYVKALSLRDLRYARILTREQFAGLPPRFISVVAPTKQQRLRRREQLGQARREIRAPVYPRLSQCYDYFQKAADDQEHVLFHLYKMIETIEEHYGGERKAVEALGSALLKGLKQLGNEDSRDQRHAPKLPGTGVPLTAGEQARALEDGHALLRLFEERLLQVSRPA